MASSSFIKYATLRGLSIPLVWQDDKPEDGRAADDASLPAKGSTSLERINSRWGENSVRGMPRSLARKRDSREVERPERFRIELPAEGVVQ